LGRFTTDLSSSSNSGKSVSLRTGKNQLYEETKDFLTPEVLLNMMKEQSRIKQSKNELKLYRSTHEFSTRATLSLQVRGKF